MQSGEGFQVKTAFKLVLTNPHHMCICCTRGSRSISHWKRCFLGWGRELRFGLGQFPSFLCCCELSVFLSAVVKLSVCLCVVNVSAVRVPVGFPPAPLSMSAFWSAPLKLRWWLRVQRLTELGHRRFFRGEEGHQTQLSSQGFCFSSCAHVGDFLNCVSDCLAHGVEDMRHVFSDSFDTWGV